MKIKERVLVNLRCTEKWGASAVSSVRSGTADLLTHYCIVVAAMWSVHGSWLFCQWRLFSKNSEGCHSLGLMYEMKRYINSNKVVYSSFIYKKNHVHCIYSFDFI